MMHSQWLFALAVLVSAPALAPASVHAQASPGAAASPATSPSALTDAVTPDRPGFTNGSDVVPVGRVQVEGGVTRTTYNAASGAGQATDAPEVLVRTGLSDTTELRITLPNYIWPSGGSANGFSDGAVGIRYKFYQSKDGNTKFAFTPSLSVPIKSAVTTSGHVDPTFLLSGQTTSGARWGISSNLILSYPTQNGSRLANYTATAQVTYALSGPLAVFGDIYDNGVSGSLPAPIADGGFTYKVATNAQLDIETGYGLGGTAATRFYGGGVAVRF
ncbi:MAG: transporter [Janthinobacterium lividum]